MCIAFLTPLGTNRSLWFNICRFFPPFRLPSIMSKRKRKQSEVEEDATLIPKLTSRIEQVENKVLLLNKELSEIKMLLSHIQSRRAQTRSLYHSVQDDDVVDNSRVNDAGQYNFTKDGGYVVVYTDGACENNGRSNAKAGFGVYFGKDCPLNVSEPVVGKATNNTAEIQACACALEIAHRQGIKKLIIKTDSQFVINSITQWIYKWKKNNWKLASGGDVKNKEDFVILDKNRNLLEDVQWVYVEGHKGHIGNEEADRLAKHGASMYHM